jgi:integron integrase
MGRLRRGARPGSSTSSAWPCARAITASARRRPKVSASTQNQALSALLFLYRHVLGRPVGELGDVVRAHVPSRVPVVLTRDEVRAVLAQLDDESRLLASLMYGAGLRLSECLRLRVQDVDFDQHEITVRAGKGNKDRRTMLPSTLEPALTAQLERARWVHRRDLADGWGAVTLPGALDRKYPAASTDWRWQWVFPQSRRRRNERTGQQGRHHVHASVIQRAFKEAVGRSGVALLSRWIHCWTDQRRSHAE